MTKVTVAGVCREYLDSNTGTEYTVEDLHAVCTGKGLAVTPQQVYGSVQVLASTGKALRGSSTRTYRSVNQPVIKELLKPVKDITPVKAKAKRRSTKVWCSDEDVLKQLTEALGQGINQQCPVIALYFQLDGNAKADVIIERYQNRVKKDVTVWYHFLVAGTTIVALPL